MQSVRIIRTASCGRPDHALLPCVCINCKHCANVVDAVIAGFVRVKTGLAFDNGKKNPVPLPVFALRILSPVTDN